MLLRQLFPKLISVICFVADAMRKYMMLGIRRKDECVLVDTPDRIRTCTRRIRNPLHYPIMLRGQISVRIVKEGQKL